jgi:hypothetical protein
MTPQQKKVKDAAAVCKAQVQKSDVAPMSRAMWDAWGSCLKAQFKGAKKAPAKGKGGKKK